MLLCHYVDFVMPSLFDLDLWPCCRSDVSVLLLVLNAAVDSPTMLALFPHHLASHYTCLRNTLPHHLPASLPVTTTTTTATTTTSSLLLLLIVLASHYTCLCNTLPHYLPLSLLVTTTTTTTTATVTTTNPLILSTNTKYFISIVLGWLEKWKKTDHSFVSEYVNGSNIIAVTVSLL